MIKKILLILTILLPVITTAQELMNKNFEGFRIKTSEVTVGYDTINAAAIARWNKYVEDSLRIKQHLLNDTDTVIGNEYQNLSNSKNVNNVTLNISNGIGTTFSVADGDSSTTNEIQDLSRTGNTLSLSNDATTVDLSDLVNPDLTIYRQKSDHDSLSALDEKSYNSLTDKPTSLPASDVYPWAKEATKPTYTKSEVGLSNVDNTSDANKPISTATQTALNAKLAISDTTNKWQPKGSYLTSFTETDPTISALVKSIDAADTTWWGRYEIDTITLDQRDIVDGQVVVVDSVGILYNTTTAATSTGCTSYIDCEGCTEIRMKVPVLTPTPTWGVLFYDADKNPIAQSGVFRPQKTVAGVDTFIFTKSGVTATSGYVPYGHNSSGNYTPVGIPSNAKYFRTGYWNYANAMGVYGSWKCVLITKRGYFGGGKNRPYQSGRINFSVAVNQSVSNFWDTGATNQEPSSLASSPGVLILPSTYTRDGRPTKLIMFCHGMSKAVSYNFWGEPSGDNTNFLAQKERWRSAGFAVFDCNGPSANSGASISAVGCPQSVGAYRQCYQYILDHYNVDPELYVIGGSMGGAVALNYCFSF